MPTPWTSIAPKPVSDHEIIVFYDVDNIDVADGPGTTFGRLLPVSGSGPLPADQEEACRGRHANGFIWRQAEPDDAGRTAFRVGEDLHPHIRDILTGARNDLATRWLPTEQTTRLLASADLYEQHKPAAERSRKLIVLKRTAAAEARMRVLGMPSRDLKLTIEAFDLTLFETRKGLMQVRLRFSPLDNGQPLTAIELLEAVYALSRFNSFRWVSAAQNHETVGPEFTLGTLMRSLCFDKLGASHPSGRVFTYWVTRFDASLTVDEADLFALYAARHYTTDYQISPGIEGVRRVRDFITVGHALALEGGATVIAPPPDGKLPDFLKTFKANAVHANYLPILTLALHEHGFLVEKTSTALLTAQQRMKPELVRAAFAALARASLDFRIFFRYTEVSEITMHNAFNRALRDVLGLDRMQAEFSGDVAEISAFLERQALRERAEVEHHRSTRFWFLGVIGTGILAALSVGTLLTQVMKNRGMFFEAWEHPLVALQSKEAPEFIGLLAGLLVLVGTCFVGYLKRPLATGMSAGEEAGGFAEEAGRDFIVDRARE
jgi:hypothetical protein